MLKNYVLFLIVFMGLSSFGQTFLDFTDATYFGGAVIPFGFPNAPTASLVDVDGNNVLQITGTSEAYDGVYIALDPASANPTFDLSDDTNNTITFEITVIQAGSSGKHMIQIQNGTSSQDVFLEYTAPTSIGTHLITLDIGSGFASNYNVINLYTDGNFAEDAAVVGVSSTYNFDNFSFATTWTGNTNSNWNAATNWTNGVPTNTTNVIIPNVTTDPVISVPVSDLNNIDIKTGASLTLNSGQSLTILGDLTQNGDFIINSDITSSASLILKGSYFGQGLTTYNRYVSNLWHLLSSPLFGSDIATFVTNDITTKPGKIAIAPYNNTLVGDKYEYLTTATGTFTGAKGYAVKKNAAGLLPFKGVIYTTDYPVTITDGSATGNKWNLVGNPYLSSIQINNNANATDNFLLANSDQLDPLRTAIYVWNAAENDFDIINQTTTGAYYIAPGQSFFVESKDMGGLVNFKEDIQTHQTGNIFLKNDSNDVPSISLKVSNGASSKTSTIKYYDAATTGIDAGYDAGVFSGFQTDLNIYTKLVSDESEARLGIQSLPKNNLENIVIPLGLTAIKGEKLKISGDVLNLPKGIKLFIEDNLLNAFTEIKGIDKVYEINTANNIDGFGRFSLHLVSKSLSATEEQLEDLVIYMNAKNQLNVKSIQNSVKSIKVYNMLGKEVFSTTLSNNIELPSNFKGVYIIEVFTSKRSVTKKIIL